MDFGTNVEAPDPRNLYRETSDTLRAQLDLAPRIFEAENDYRRRYAQLDREITRDNLLGEAGLLQTYLDAGPRLNQLSADSNRAMREADLQDFEQLGGRYRDSMLAATGNRSLLAELNAQAEQELAAGGGLSSEEEFDARQRARVASEQRGRTFGNQAVLDELMNAERLRNAREDRSRALAAGVIGLNQQVVGDPFLAVTGRQSQVTGMVPGVTAQGQSVRQGSIGMFDPMNPYAADLYNTNYNAEAAAQISSANNRAGLFAGILGLGSGLGAAAIGR